MHSRQDIHFHLSSPPHLHDEENVKKIMTSVCIALIPIMGASIWIHKIHAVLLFLVCIGVAVFTEWGILILKTKQFQKGLEEPSACITGILLALVLPYHTPWWMASMASVIAIGIGKQLGGGLGKNPLNPTLTGRLFLMIAFPKTMFPMGKWSLDTITQATSLTQFRIIRDLLSTQENLGPEGLTQASLILSRLYESFHRMVWNPKAWCMGEISGLCVLIGAFFLIYRRTIGFKTPMAFLISTGLFAWTFSGTEGFFSGNPLFHLTSGGILLSAFFMITDPVTSPTTSKDRMIFGAGCGLLTMGFRTWGPQPEGTTYAILLMNALFYLKKLYILRKNFSIPKIHEKEKKKSKKERNVIS